MSTDNLYALAEEREKRKRKRKGDNQPPPAGGEADQRPVVRLAPGELRSRVADEAEAALLASGIELYRQGGRIVRVVWDKIKVAGGGDGDVLRLSTVEDAHILSCFEQSARFEKWSNTAEDFLACDCPKDTAAAYLARDGQWSLPYLMGVITAPTIRPDGSILDRPGYDLATGLVFDPVGVAFPPVPLSPTRADALAALAVLKEPISQFPFVAGAHMAVALSGIMTAVVRRALPTAPLHAFTAPVAGSGKSMLVDIASVIATGERAAVTSPGRDKFGDAELEKRLTASMLAGDAVISLDNLEAPLGGELLCSLLTQTRVRLRILGRSVNIEVPVTTSFFATSNNLVVVGDLTRRVLAATLDPAVERPELREFSFNPLQMAKERRGELVCAALTIARAWIISGETARESPLGSFEDWCRLVRDPLIWLGEADPVDVMEDLRKGDPRLAKLKTVTDAWGAAFGQQMLTLAEVVKAAEERWPHAGPGDELWKNRDLRDALLSILPGGDGHSLNPEKLAWWLRKNSGRFAGKVRFVSQDGAKQRLWGLEGELPPGAGQGAGTATQDDDIPF